MSFGQAFRAPTSDGDVHWRARCTGFPVGSCPVIILASKASGLCYFCERSKSKADLPKLECGLPLDTGRNGREARCQLPIGHLNNRWSPKHKPVRQRTT